MGLHVRNLCGRHTSAAESLRVQLALGRRIRNGDGSAVRALVHCCAENGAQDDVLVSQSLSKRFEDENAGAFAAAISISLGIEGARSTCRTQKRSRGQVLVEAGASDKVDTPGNGDGAFLCLKGLLDVISLPFRKPCLAFLER